MIDLLSGAVCVTMKAAAVGAQTERRGVAVAGEVVAWRQGLTGRFVFQTPDSIFLLFDTQQFRRLGPDAPKDLVRGPILVGPRDGLRMPLAGGLLLSELPVGHGQEKPVVAVASLAHLHGL